MVFWICEHVRSIPSSLPGVRIRWKVSLMWFFSYDSCLLLVIIAYKPSRILATTVGRQSSPLFPVYLNSCLKIVMFSCCQSLDTFMILCFCEDSIHHIMIISAGSFRALSGYLSGSGGTKLLRGLSAFILSPSPSWALVSSLPRWSYPFQFEGYLPW